MGNKSMDEASWSHLESGNMAVLQIHCLYIQWKSLFFVLWEPLAIKSGYCNYTVNHLCQSEEVLSLIFIDWILYIKLTFQNSLSIVYILWPFCLISFV